MYEEVAFERPSRKVVDTTGAICYIAHDDGFYAVTEGFQDVGDGGGEEEKPFGHLEGYPFTAMTADGVDGLVELEVVVFGEESRDGGVQLRVVEDVVGDCGDGA